jgi:hypothetical protein
MSAKKSRLLRAHSRLFGVDPSCPPGVNKRFASARSFRIFSERFRAYCVLSNMLFWGSMCVCVPVSVSASACVLPHRLRLLPRILCFLNVMLLVRVCLLVRVSGCASVCASASLPHPSAYVYVCACLTVVCVVHCVCCVLCVCACVCVFVCVCLCVSLDVFVCFRRFLPHRFRTLPRVFCFYDNPGFESNVSH